MASSRRKYTVGDLELIDFRESVRRRPAMYFGMGRERPELASAVLAGVLSSVLHPVAELASAHHPVGQCEVVSDMVFVVCDDQAMPLSTTAEY